MSTAIEDFLADAPPAPAPGPADYQRDRWGRPLVIPANGSEPQPYQRASGAAKPIEDTYGLEMWARRNVAYGLAHDRSLVARVLAIGGTPDVWTKDQRDEIAKVVENAATVAQAHKAADTGTSLHTMTQRADLGETVQAGIFQDHLDAYRATLDAAGIVVHSDWIECQMVCDELEMAGTADRLVTLTADSPLRWLIQDDAEAIVLDLKTGRTVEYGALGFASDFAAYSRGVLYDPATHDRLPTPRICQGHGIIVHLPATATDVTCSLHIVDLERGFEAARTANVVRQVRKDSKAWMTGVDLTPKARHLEPVPDPPPVDAGEHLATASAALRARLQEAVRLGATNITWPAGVPTFKNGGPGTWAQVLEVERCVLDAENAVGAPFQDQYPAEPGPAGKPLAKLADPVVKAPAPTFKADPEQVGRLRAIHDTLPTDLQAQAHAQVTEMGIDPNRVRWTSDDLPRVAQVLDAAVATGVARVQQVEQLLAGWDDRTIVEALLVTATGDRQAPLTTLTALDAERITALSGALHRNAVRWQLSDTGDPSLTTHDTTEQHLLDVHGTKTALIAVAKTAAALHGRPTPRSATQVAADPVLTALALAGAAD